MPPHKVSDYVEQRKAERRSDCTNCGTADARCTDRVLMRAGACCSVCYSTDTHPPMPEPESLHEIIFWEIRSSGITRDEREWADWIMRLCHERVLKHLPDKPEDDSAKVWSSAVTQVAREFEIPEGRGA